ncbi:MAG: hypothetical protein LN561_06755 [Rickettsia endosymbiont of Labidopullus appendiculatus]|nr:hypothetical protein [Rickettsia endosymbiont of Labidopullus appendiculatus]
MTTKFLLYPQLRMEVKGSFEDLADYDRQMKEWVDEQYPHPYSDSLTYYVINTLYDSCDLDKYKESNIGEILYDEDEAQQIYKFCKWFGDLIDSISLHTDETNSDYLNHPEWSKVYIGAKEMYELMDRNDKKYHFSEIANS